jgi:Thiopurine S-methyltransferase (TPMT)
MPNQHPSTYFLPPKCNNGKLHDLSGRSSPALLKLLQENKIPEGRALVPGCGRGYDVVTLASQSRKALGVPLSKFNFVEFGTVIKILNVWKLFQDWK